MQREHVRPNGGYRSGHRTRLQVGAALLTLTLLAALAPAALGPVAAASPADLAGADRAQTATEGSAGAATADPTQLLVKVPAGEDAADLLAGLTAVSPSAADAAAATPAEAGVFTIDGQEFVVLDVSGAVEAAEVTETLTRRGAHVEPDVTVTGDRSPNDPRYDPVWGDRLGSERVWAAGTGQGVTLAVLDTGVQAGGDLPAGRLQAGYDAIADQTGPTDGDVDTARHGTNAAEVAAGSGDNAFAAAGGCWDCAVLPVRVLGPDRTGKTAHVARGIEWAVDAGADVLNLSLSAPAATAPLTAALDYALDAGVVVVASAGNHGSAEPRWPAAHPGVLGVAGLAIDDPDTLDPRSSFGPHIDLAAPMCANVGEDGRFCGTSAAAPIVAGHAASLLSIAVQPSAAEVTAALEAAARPVGGVAAGRLDAAAALARLTALPEVTRVAGQDRYATAAALAAATGGGDAGTVVLASGVSFPDALAAGPALGAQGPVLLTRPDRLPEVTIEALETLAPRQIVVAGGPQVISADVVAEAGRYARTVTRVAGPDRYATAAALSRHAPAGDEVWLVPGRDLPTGLEGASRAAAAGAAALLFEPDRLPEATAARLEDLQPRRVVVYGPIEERVRTTLGRYTDTVTVLPAASAPAAAGTAQLATVDGAVDALAGAAAAARLGGPVIITTDGALDARARAHLDAVAADRLILLGRAATLPNDAVR